MTDTATEENIETGEADPVENSDDVVEEVNGPDYLNMTDEEMLAAPIPAMTAEEPKEEDPKEDPEPKPEDPKEEEDPEDKKVEEEDPDKKKIEEEEPKPDNPDEPDPIKKDEENPVEEPEAKKKEEDKPKDEIDYKAAYERILAPFKANGREITVKDIEGAISLMQMGANYNKKMAGLKPNLKLLKQLENNDLLSEDKIGFFIDLSKKDPKAINKLIKDSGLDPLEFDADKAGEYKQTNRTVTDSEIDLDTVIQELEGSASFDQVLDTIGNKWDSKSRQIVADQPQILRIINDHVNNGYYDLIVAEVENERVFGRLKGLSDIDAYQQVGDILQQKGAFNKPDKSSSPTPAKSDTEEDAKDIKPKSKTVDAEKLRKKKRAAAGNKEVKTTSKSQDYNPLSLSDEEFSKLSSQAY